VPCGRCLACRINKTQEWSLRIMQELEYWPFAVFVTLTYNDSELEKLPLESIDKKELQAYFKRLRKNTNRIIKYYACGEYGEKTGRPHYHAIIFGLDINNDFDREEIDFAWSKGYTYIGTVTHDSAQYVAGYVFKKYNGKKGMAVYGFKQPPFQLQSKGLGLQYALENSAQIKNKLHITKNGKKIPIPRYYRKQLKITETEYKEIITEQTEKLRLHYESLKLSGTHKINYIYKLNKQRNEELITRMGTDKGKI